MNRIKLAKPGLYSFGIEVKMGPHGLRHSFATHMLQNGADIVTIAECLGHVSLSNTQKYTHLAMVDIIDAYNIAHPRRRGPGKTRGRVHARPLLYSQNFVPRFF